jgi:hypothetical protein
MAPAPSPRDPLDDPMAEFLRAIDEYLTIRLDYEPPTMQTSTDGGVEALKRVWEEGKQNIRKFHSVISGVQPEMTERLQLMVQRGEVLLGLTNDSFIVDYVNGLTGLLTETNADVDRLTATLSKAAESIWGFIALVMATAGIKARMDPRAQQIATMRNDLRVYYYEMRTPPPRSA